MNKDRILAFSDAIIAIAATIMVLELKIPPTLNIESLLSLTPTLFAYLVSFILIYITWRSHHNAFEKAEIVTGTTFLINGIWILLVTLIPFVTGLLGQYPYDSLSNFIYVLTILLWTLTFQFLDISITKSNQNVKADEMRNKNNRIVIFGGFLLALVISLYIPQMSLIIVAIASLITAIQIIRKTKNNRI